MLIEQHLEAWFNIGVQNNIDNNPWINKLTFISVIYRN